MIDKFAMARVCLSRLEKYARDRVWNDPYLEYRTNTRPRILNTSTEVAGDAVSLIEYMPTAGVYSGRREQIQLPSADSYYLYSIEDNQFRSIYLNSNNWTRLDEYCNNSLTSLQVFTDDGVFLWRGGIYIRKDVTSPEILLAVNERMFHTCTDISGNRGNPAAIIFSKCVDSDRTEKYEDIGKTKLSSSVIVPDNSVSCTQINNYNVGSALSSVSQGGATTMAFVNGHLCSGSYATSIKAGAYVESVGDGDILKGCPMTVQVTGDNIYGLDDTRMRLLIHIPLTINPDKYLISYTTCDVFVVPTMMASGVADRVASSSGRLVHFAGREDQFHQLTFNDFSIDLDLLDTVAANAGAKISYAGGKVTERNYVVRVYVRHYNKTPGLARDADYCDMLYSYKHKDVDIINLMCRNGNYSQYGLTFWSAQHLELYSAYAQEMNKRIGSTIPRTKASDPTHGYFRRPIELRYLPGKIYYKLNHPGISEQEDEDPSVLTPEEASKRQALLDNIQDDVGIVNDTTGRQIIDHGLKLPTDAETGNPLSTLLGNPDEAIDRYVEFSEFSVGDLVADDVYEFVQIGLHVKQGESDMYPNPVEQCSKCSLLKYCTDSRNASALLKTTNLGLRAKWSSVACPMFAYRSISDYIKIFGYYHTLALVCKRVTTYRVTSANRKRFDKVGEGDEATLEFVYENNEFPVRVPLALDALTYTEFYPLVYLNGTKLDDSLVTIVRDTNRPVVTGLKEIHYVYSASFADDDFWEPDQRRLIVKIDDSVAIKLHDYITIELVPDPADVHETDPAVANYKMRFGITEFTDVTKQRLTRTTTGESIYGTQCIGYDQFCTRATTAGQPLQVESKNSELVFLNGKQLVINIDYTPFAEYKNLTDTKDVVSSTPLPHIQNVSYLYESDIHITGEGDEAVEDAEAVNRLEYIATTDEIIGTSKGFVVGNWIEWDGNAPFWFDNLSILTVGGKVCSNFAYRISGIDIHDTTHENGEPYMVRTSVPESVLEFMGEPELREEDTSRMVRLREYFESIADPRPYRALIPYSHRVYSSFQLMVIRDYLLNIGSENEWDPNNETELRAKLLFYEKWREFDVAYKIQYSENADGISVDNLRFVDIYPIFHNLMVDDRQVRRDIETIVKYIKHDDMIRHRGHING